MKTKVTDKMIRRVGRQLKAHLESDAFKAAFKASKHRRSAAKKPKPSIIWEVYYPVWSWEVFEVTASSKKEALQKTKDGEGLQTCTLARYRGERRPRINKK